ncbi:MAG: hypothetical protein KDN19_01810 [Verrucomicrobiae bacterium]|nr:hypothetical protein [Verrucomicrobiae bacterium]
MTGPSEPSQPTTRGGIFRRLAIPFSVFAAIASVALVGWTDHTFHRESLRQFRDMAEANARMIDRLRLPHSPELAQKLAAVLGVSVGFRYSDRLSEDLEPAIADTIEGLVADKAKSGRTGAWEIAVAPVSGGSAHLLLLRERERFLADASSWLLPVVIVTVFGGGIAFLIARRLVRPLVLLDRWLPNLDRESPASPPAEVIARPDEIGALARSLAEGQRRLHEEQALRRQSERLATLGRIATSLAHEIRNPAAAIRLHADLMARATCGEENAESIDLIRDETDRITDLVNQWLFVARGAPPKTETSDLTELARRVLHRLKPQLDHAGVTAEILGEFPVSASIDAARMEQVLRNLFLNAAQAMPEGGRVFVHLEQQNPDEAIIRIRDHGPGFSETAIERWHEPFFSEREGGMGLGLTLVAEVVQGHGGSVAVANPPDGGAEVTLRIPNPS